MGPPVSVIKMFATKETVIARYLKKNEKEALEDDNEEEK